MRKVKFLTRGLTFNFICHFPVPKKLQSLQEHSATNRKLKTFDTDDGK